ncbi:MAG: ankyrin repeat domain-containing protein [Pyrinomonadaceae bacterium]
MKRTSLLDRVNVSAPCPADWDAMRGNEHVRFCQHCNLNVHDLSAMTRPLAEKIVRRAHGRICVRYRRRPDDSLVTADPLVQIQASVRRASRLVAGAFSAALSLCATAAAQERTPSARADASCTIAQTQRTAQSEWKGAGGYGSVAGTITDPTGAVIVKATVTLTDERGGTQTALTDDEGRFQFQAQPGGDYSLKIEAPGFASASRPVLVQAQQEVRADISLPVGEIMGGVMVSIVPEEPLVIAVGKGDLLAVHGLLATGADVNVRDKPTDRTALMAAVSTNNLELVHVLLGAGADVNARNEYGQTALMELSNEATPELVRALITAGARLNSKDKDGDSALMNVARWGSVETLRTLIAAGAKVNARNSAGDTPLMLAAAAGEVEKVKELLAAGADINRHNKAGQTALKQAKENEHDDVADLLLSYGAIVEPEPEVVP